MATAKQYEAAWNQARLDLTELRAKEKEAREKKERALSDWAHALGELQSCERREQELWEGLQKAK